MAPAAAVLHHQGIRLALPAGWEGRIRQAPSDDPDEEPMTVAHAATFALPPGMGDYGGGAVETMARSDVFLALVEFGPESVGTALFRPQGIPRLRADLFDPLTLQRVLPGQSGTQRFFTTNDRAFCLYVVLGSHLRRASLVEVAREAVDGLAFD